MARPVPETEGVHFSLRSRALPALVALLVTGACAPSSPAPTGTPSAPPSAMDDEPLRVEVIAGDVTLEVSVPGATLDDPHVRVTPDAQAGTATVTLERSVFDDAADADDADDADGTDDTGDPVVLALTSGGSFEPRVDGSVTVRTGKAAGTADTEGTAVGGLSPPQGARLVAADATHLEVRPLADAASGRPDDDVTTTLGTSAVERTDWGDREGGRSLAVVPTAWAREAGQAGTDLVWAELVAADPEVGTATMHDQLECHAIGAPDKDSWNLEPWRPDVGLVATMAARCNPT
ncbi:hypothetical protein JCM11754A_24540 [Isoptericola variabilis]